MKDNQHPEPGSRYARGSAIFEEALGIPADAFAKSLADVAPRFTRYVMEWEFADMVGESSLDARTREIVAITSLATLGATGAAVLKLRIASALKAGRDTGSHHRHFYPTRHHRGLPDCTRRDSRSSGTIFGR